MNKLYGVSLLILCILLLIGCMPTQTTDMKITFEKYGGYVVPEMAIQVLSVNPDKIIFSTSDIQGRTTSLLEKNITKEEYDAITSIIVQNRYTSFKDTYSSPSPPSNSSLAKLTIIEKDKVKVITIDPYDPTILPDNVKNVVDELESVINNIFNMDEKNVKSIAENFITNSPTYKNNGSELMYLSMNVQESYPPRYVVTYNFTAAEGYGDRSDIAGVKSLTAHQIVITMTQGKIIAAVIDNKWDELHQRAVGNYAVEFQPLQCIDPPWRKWYNATVPNASKNISEEAKLITFYATNYGIRVDDFKIHYPDNPVIAVCGNPESYYITASVSNAHVNQMLKIGWTEVKE